MNPPAIKKKRLFPGRHAIFAILLSCVLLLGCGDSDADSENPGSAMSKPPVPGTLDLRLVLPDASAVLGMQVAKVLEQEGMKPFVVVLQETIYRQQELKFQDFQQVVMVMPPAKDKQRPNQSAVIFTLKEGASTDAAGLIKELSRGQPVESSRYNGQTLQLTKHGAFCRLNDRTVVVAKESELKWLLDSQSQEGQGPAWLASAKSLTGMDGFFAYDASEVSEQMLNMPLGRTNPMQMFAPFWLEPVTVVGGMTLTGKLSYKVIANCRDEKGAEKLVNTVDSLIPLGRNMLDGAKTQLEKVPLRNKEGAEMQATIIGMADDLLTNLKVQQNGTEVTVSTSTNTDVGKTLVAALMPAVMQAREAKSEQKQPQADRHRHS